MKNEKPQNKQLPNEQHIRRVTKNSNQEATAEIEMKTIKKSKIITITKSEIITDNDLLDFITGNKITDINSLHRTRSLSTYSLKLSSSETSCDEQTSLDNIKNEKELSQEEKMKKFVKMVEKNIGKKEIEKNARIGKEIFKSL